MPEPRPNIFPIVAYRDEPAAIEWLCAVFGFEKLMVVQNEDGTIAHAELKLGPGVIMPSSNADKGRKSPIESGVEEWGPYVFLEDAALRAHYAHAKAGGAVIVRELTNQDYGGASYTAKDLEGYEWSFGSYYPGTPEPG